MKTTTILFAIFSVINFNLLAQNHSSVSYHQEEEHISSENNSEHPCISTEQYTFLENESRQNRQYLHISEPIESTTKALTVLEYWPVKASADLNDCSFYRVSAYVDQDQNAGSSNDWNCGTKTYDGHRGTDISTWPFNFYKMDNNLVEVVAAASGIIIAKNDGEFDRNCSGNSLTANYIMLQHQDGSHALYWHMKSGSVTSKIVGEAVVAGEYLGVVGSSGSSSGPHLHFEIWEGATVATRIDPFSGTCNTLNPSSWWASQKQHKETSIVKASVHTTDAVFPPCPATETLNESNLFSIPFQGPGLPAGFAKFYIFIRDEINGFNADMKILNPNGSTYLAWNYVSPSDNSIRTFSWSKLLPTISGVYTFEASYNGTTCSSTFEINGLADIQSQEIMTSSKIYPNPTNGKFNLELDNNLADEIEIFSLCGQIVHQSIIQSSKTEFNLFLSKGIYSYKIKNKGTLISVGKLIID